MQKMFELYEMVSLNDVDLCGSERTAILDARRALRMFEHAMERFKCGTPEPAAMAKVDLRVAA